MARRSGGERRGGRVNGEEIKQGETRRNMEGIMHRNYLCI
jgi:hypothetical protein